SVSPPPVFAPRDPQKVKSLLAECGYRGEPLALCPTWAPRPHTPDPPAIAAEISRLLGECGIRVQEEPTPPRDEYFRRQAQGRFDLMLWGWIADVPDPAAFLDDNLGSANIGTTNV